MKDALKESAIATMRRINRAWLDRRVQDMAPLLHPDVVMVYPGFTDSGQGRAALMDGFERYVQSTIVHEFEALDWQAEVAGNIAVVSYRFDTVWEQSGKRNRSTGRDLWVFQREGDGWVAVWRTMLEMADSAA